VKDAVLVVNDMWASMPRSLASYYFTFIAFLRSMRYAAQTGAKKEIDKLALSLHPKHHLSQPVYYLAYAGVPFEGPGAKNQTVPFPRVVIIRDFMSTYGCVDSRDPPHVLNMLAKAGFPELFRCNTSTMQR